MRSYTCVLVMAGSLFLGPASASGQFVQQGQKLVGTGAIPMTLQGVSVALSANGNTAIVGGSSDNVGAGAAWIFTRSNGVWAQQGAKLVGSRGNFGRAVALSADGNTAVVGGYLYLDDVGMSGAVWIFVRNGSTWTQQGEKLIGTGASNPAQQGFSVALSADGNTALVGARLDAFHDGVSEGAAWVFTRDNGVWTQQGSKLVGTGAIAAEQGSAVALSADGNIAAVGGRADNANAGAVWIFTRSGSTWTQQGSKLTPTGATGPSAFGNSVALSGNGNYLMVGGNTDNSSAGAAWVFARNGSTWTQQGSKLVGMGAVGAAGQGSSVSLSANGALAIVGGPRDGTSPNDGAAWAYVRNGSTWSPLGAKLVGTGAFAGSFQGLAVALSSDGSTAIVGGTGDNSSLGATWVYGRAPHTPADFDGDHTGDLTLVKANGDWTTFSSTSGFGSSSSVSLTGQGFAPVIGDYDGDGKQDPAIYNRRTGDWLIKKSSTNYSTTMTASFGNTVWVPVPGDYDGDGKMDIAVCWTRAGAWSIIPSSGAPGFTVTWGTDDSTPVPGQDFDGDFVSDIAVYRRSTGMWSILTSSSGFTSSLSVSWGGPGYWLVPGDYDGDRKADPALYQPANGTWHVLESGTGYTTARNMNWGGIGYMPVPGDYDGDAKIDLGLYHQDTGSFYALLSATSYTSSLARALGGSRLDVPLSTAIAFGGDEVTRASDYDGDAIADITAYNTTSGVWSTLTSGSHYGSAINRTWGGTGYSAVNGDFDGDGHSDLGLYDQQSGSWTVRLSSTNFATTLSKTVGGPGWAPVPADYDGDRKTDFVVYNTTTGQWYGLKSGSNYAPTLNVNLGGAGYQPVPGDYDGDGWADVAVYESATGNWSVLITSITYTQGTQKWSVGGAGWMPVPADYDGDGVTDYAVYNTTTGQWYVIKSSSGSPRTINVNWGGSGYVPVKGDFDGDGKADLATYVASSGAWYILLSGANYTTAIARSAGGAGWVALPAYP